MINAKDYEQASDDRKYVENGVAKLLGMSEAGLRALRKDGKGPKPCREFAGTAWYRKGDIEDFRNSRP